MLKTRASSIHSVVHWLAAVSSTLPDPKTEHLKSSAEFYRHSRPLSSQRALQTSETMELSNTDISKPAPGAEYLSLNTARSYSLSLGPDTHKHACLIISNSVTGPR